jgi:hypothetical protein
MTPDDVTGIPTDGPARVPATATARGPQADRDLLALHALRQRQLRTAFLHGTRRNWRDSRRVWPAVVVALVIIGVAVAAIGRLAAFRLPTA